MASVLAYFVLSTPGNVWSLSTFQRLYPNFTNTVWAISHFSESVESFPVSPLDSQPA